MHLRRRTMSKRYLRPVLFSGFCFLLAATLYAESAAFKDFNALRKHLLERFANARLRIWVYSDYLSDGDVVSSLFVANYRKLDIRVRLSKKFANQYMSRYDDLKRQSINVALVSTSPNYPTVVVVDDKSYSYDQSLNFMLKGIEINETEVNEPERSNIVGWFNGTPLSGVTNKQLVPSSTTNVHNNNEAAQVQTTASGESVGSGVYYYDRSQRAPRPDDDLKQLPKQPLYMKNRKSGIVRDQTRSNLEFDPRIFDPVTAKEPIIRSPKSPESY